MDSHAADLNTLPINAATDMESLHATSPTPEKAVSDTTEVPPYDVQSVIPPVDDDSMEPETAPRTSEDRHPLNMSDTGFDDVFFDRLDSAQDFDLNQVTPQVRPVESTSSPDESALSMLPTESIQPDETATHLEDSATHNYQREDFPQVVEPKGQETCAEAQGAEQHVNLVEAETAVAETVAETAAVQPENHEEPAAQPTAETVEPASDALVSEQSLPYATEDTRADIPALHEEHEQPDIESMDTEAIHETNPEAPALEGHPQEEHYEAQGEMTSMEEAVQEDASIPLAQQIESPALDWDNADDAFDVASSQPFSNSEEQGGDSARKLLEDFANEHQTTQSGASASDWGKTADFDLGEAKAEDLQGENGILHDKEEAFGEPKVEVNVELAKASDEDPDLDWGAANESTFDLSGSQAAHDTAFQTGTGSSSEEKENGKSNDQDLSALWAEALADDDLLDESAPVDAAPVVDPSAFFLDDDEGFLEDEAQSGQTGASNTDASQSVPGNATGQSTASKYAPATTPAASTQSATGNSYAPSAPQFTDLSQGRPTLQTAQTAPYKSHPHASPYGVPAHYQQPQRPQMPSSAQSFADKSKGGYSSPFDLPEDVVKPRRRPGAQMYAQPVSQPTPPPGGPPGPPPRSSSMYSNPSMSTKAAPVSPSMSVASQSRPSSSHSAQKPSAAFGVSTPASRPGMPASNPTTEGFFEELPIVPKPKPAGRYTPKITSPTPPPPPSQTAPPQGFGQPWAPPPRQNSLPSQPPAATQLQQPERLPTFPDIASQTSGAPLAPAPPAVNRYSPAPPGAAAAAAANARYSPAPPAAPALGARYAPGAAVAAPPRPPSVPFAPRTSSPLAYHSMPQQEQPSRRPSASSIHSAHNRQESLQPSITSNDEYPSSYRRGSLEQVREMPEQERPIDQHEVPATPPPLATAVFPAADSPSRRTTSSYTPQSQPVFSPPTSGPGATAFRRSQSQSPGITMKGPKLATAPVDRPASVNGPYEPVVASTNNPPVVTSRPHRRTFSRDISFVTPSDDRSQDPLERWKGYPIFKWGLGGTILTSFPKQIPRYSAVSAAPMTMCTPGEVKLQSAKTLCPLAENMTKFPGPLKAKGKKKEVISWMKTNIEAMEKDLQTSSLNGDLPNDQRVRFEEKILLWKLLETFVENDGRLEGSDDALKAVRKVLAPESVVDSDAEPELVSPLVSSTGGSVPTAEPTDPEAVSQLRRFLLTGDREKAVWHAADKGLWSHAMLISTTLSKDVWKQVVQEFVRQQVKTLGGNTQSLAALYEIFAGNWEESIDELVPASARAGFQMVSKADRSGTNTNVLEGLDRWRETLLLVISNRSEGDNQALLSMGKLLAGYGRVEAAHICHLFARSTMVLSGIDDPAAHVVLFGADHLSSGFDISRDMEAVLLTEVYEFAVTVLATPAGTSIPHLQAYKLAHAFSLAEHGYKNEAQSYCDAIGAAMSSKTRPSPYYQNAALLSELNDLSNRLSQSPKDGSTSWISKPTMGKVSSSAWSTFTKFVAGEESDGASTASGIGNEVGPFAKMAGDTPTISRSPSSADLYGSYPAGAAAMSPPTNMAGSRYAPSAYNGRSSLDQQRPRYDTQSQSSPYLPVRPSTAEAPQPMRQVSDYATGSHGEMGMDPLFSHQQESTPPSSYTPSFMPPPAKPQTIYAPTNQAYGASPNFPSSPYHPSPLGEAMETSGYQPPQSYEPPASSYEPPTSNYEPPASSYEPPTSSYQPPDAAAEEQSESLVQEQRKKKSIMDDDDDDELERRAAALKAQQKAQADREADEAFRKAAEADAAKPGPEKKSWLSGWFKKSDDQPKAIRAKLGEENSFYYDPDLKKWINKKAGPGDASSAPGPSGTPPPPKGGPPSRSVSGSSAPPRASLPPMGGAPPTIRSVSSTSNLAAPPMSAASGLRSTSVPPPMAAPDSRASTPGMTEGGMTPPVGVGAGAAGGGPPTSAPPSRPATSMSNASSIDDLLGVPAPRKGAAGKKGKRGGRYVDVMAK